MTPNQYTLANGCSALQKTPTASALAGRANKDDGRIPAGDATARNATAARPTPADAAFTGHECCESCCPCRAVHATLARLALDAPELTGIGARACASQGRRECLYIVNALFCITSKGLSSMHGFDALTAICSFRASLKLPVQDKQLPRTSAKFHAAENWVVWDSQ